MPLALPAELLHAVSERRGRIALVVGAGCSIEGPTNLHLAAFYAQEAHRQLVLDGLLTAGDCSNPRDLSAVASALRTRHASQSALVQRLPRNAFRLAQPNSGYLIAAALLREGVINAILTLNFDLALTAALGGVERGGSGRRPGASGNGPARQRNGDLLTPQCRGAESGSSGSLRQRHSSASGKATGRRWLPGASCPARLSFSQGSDHLQPF